MRLLGVERVEELGPKFVSLPLLVLDHSLLFTD